jgi:hypothetical protein
VTHLSVFLLLHRISSHVFILISRCSPGMLPSSLLNVLLIFHIHTCIPSMLLVKLTVASTLNFLCFQIYMLGTFIGYSSLPHWARSLSTRPFANIVFMLQLFSVHTDLIPTPFCWSMKHNHHLNKSWPQRKHGLPLKKHNHIIKEARPALECNITTMRKSRLRSHG